MNKLNSPIIPFNKWDEDKVKAFTLVELIVVITILAILATVGFVSFSGYLAGTRDTNRIAQLKSMSDALELYRTKKDLPIPDDKVDIKVGTGSNEKTIAYQGYIGKNVLETIEYTESGLDPKDKNYFSYYLTKDKKYFQLLSFLEEPSEDVVAINNKRLVLGTKNIALKTSLREIQATDYSERYPKVTGKKLGILTGTGTDLNTPIQEILTDSLNIETTTGSYIANISSNIQISGTGNILIGLNSLSLVGGKIYKSCKAILDDKSETKNKDGIYLINPEGTNPFEVYCDMTTDGGGWTFFGHYNNDSNGTNFFKGGVGNYRTDRVDDGTKYSIGVDKFEHTEMMVTVDTINTLEADKNNKIVFYKYNLGNISFNTGPIPCTGLSNGSYNYKKSIGGSYISGNSNYCTTSYWNTSLGSAILYMRNNSRGHFWGISMGGNNTWDHDGWWYLR